MQVHSVFQFFGYCCCSITANCSLNQSNPPSPPQPPHFNPSPASSDYATRVSQLVTVKQSRVLWCAAEVFTLRNQVLHFTSIATYLTKRFCIYSFWWILTLRNALFVQIPCKDFGCFIFCFSVVCCVFVVKKQIQCLLLLTIFY